MHTYIYVRHDSTSHVHHVSNTIKENLTLRRSGQTTDIHSVRCTDDTGLTPSATEWHFSRDPDPASVTHYSPLAEQGLLRVLLTQPPSHHSTVTAEYQVTSQRGPRGVDSQQTARSQNTSYHNVQRPTSINSLSS